MATVDSVPLSIDRSPKIVPDGELGWGGVGEEVIMIVVQTDLPGRGDGSAQGVSGRGEVQRVYNSCSRDYHPRFGGRFCQAITYSILREQAINREKQVVIGCARRGRE